MNVPPRDVRVVRADLPHVVRLRAHFCGRRGRFKKRRESEDARNLMACRKKVKVLLKDLDFGGMP